jgi:hypothetical protein
VIEKLAGKADFKVKGLSQFIGDHILYEKGERLDKSLLTIEEGFYS